MYVPRLFDETRPEVLHGLIEAHPLATWARVVDGAIAVDHIPFVLDRGSGTLIGHVARANPAWRTPGPSVFVFQGASAYISPSLYATKVATGEVVPTWNYAVVHARGTPRIVEEPRELLGIVTRLTERFEGERAKPWAVADAPAEFVESLLRAIVGIVVPIESIEGKWKVSQNRVAADQASVIAGLRSERGGDDPMAALVEAAAQPR